MTFSTTKDGVDLLLVVLLDHAARLKNGMVVPACRCSFNFGTIGETR